MRLLVIGGTRFIGRHLVEHALQRGHEVTVFHRGVSAPAVFPGIEHRLGDRNGDLAALSAGSWDATIDMCAYVPRHVHSLADALGERAGRYTFVSSVSAYATPIANGFGEDSPLAVLPDPTVEEVNDATYGGLKVLAEAAATERFGGGTLIVRPTYVVGPFDHSWRFPRWVMRLAEGGEVLAPGPADDPCQIIDVRDLAEWIVLMNERPAGGVFHTVGPREPLTWSALLGAVAAHVAPRGTSLSWVDPGFLVSEGITDTDLPLWPGAEPDPAMLTADPSKAVRAGLRFRPLEETVADTFTWARTSPLASGPSALTSMGRVEEANLLARWKARSVQDSLRSPDVE